MYVQAKSGSCDTLCHVYEFLEMLGKENKTIFSKTVIVIRS